jgi:hypothetical protein
LLAYPAAILGRWTGMLTVQLGEMELGEYWCEADVTLGRLSLPMHTGTGAASTAVIYFETGPRWLVSRVSKLGPR